MRKAHRYATGFLFVSLALSFVGLTAGSNQTISGVTFGDENQRQSDYRLEGLLMWQTISVAFTQVRGSLDLYVMNRENFDLWRNGEEFVAYFEKKAIDKECSIEYRVPYDGIYFVVMDNTNHTQQTSANYDLASGGPDLLFIVPALVLCAMGGFQWWRGRLEKRKQEALEGEPINIRTLQTLKKGTRTSALTQFVLLFKREFRNTFSFPTYAVLAVLAILLLGTLSRGYSIVYSVPDRPTSSQLEYLNYAIWSLNALTPWFPLLISVLTALAVSGDAEKGAITSLITFPIRRSEILGSKFLSLFSTTYFAGCVMVILGTYVRATRNQLYIPLNFYLVPAIIMLLLTFLYLSVSLLVSVLVDKALAATLVGIVMFLAWHIFIPNSLSDRKLLLLTPGTASRAINFVALQIQTNNPYVEQFTFYEGTFALTWMLALSLSSLIASFLIFRKKQF